MNINANQTAQKENNKYLLILSLCLILPLAYLIGSMEFPVPREAARGLPVTVAKRGTNPPKATFLLKAGAHEFFSPEMWKAAFVEAIATALLMFTIIISIITCLESKDHDPKTIALFIFAVFFFFLMVTIPISGGHMNPLVTYIAVLKGVTPLVRACIYILAQCIGSIAGFLLIKSMMSHDAVEKYMLGGCAIDMKGDGSGISPGTALIVEFVCTFIILYIGVTPAFNQKRCKELGLTMVCMILAASIAMAVFLSITVTGKGGYTGAGLNPARCLGPAVFQGGALWDGHWVFWIGPFLSCSIYYGLSLNLPKQELVWVEGENDLVSLIGALGDCISTTDNPPPSRV